MVSATRAWRNMDAFLDAIRSNHVHAVCGIGTTELLEGCRIRDFKPALAN
jgi:hypothetical protein